MREQIVDTRATIAIFIGIVAFGFWQHNILAGLAFGCLLEVINSLRAND